MMIDFPKADPVERGCGEREQGGVYAETGLSRYGTPLEYFLIDPPQTLPVGLDLINKPQLWEVIPQEAATEVLELEGERPFCLRKVGSTIYQYRPTGESAAGLQPGLFAALPITGFALVQFEDGTVNEGAKAKLQQAGLNF